MERLELGEPVDHLTQAELPGPLERPVRVVGAELHGAVDVRRLGHSLAGGVVRLIDDRQLDAADDLLRPERRRRRLGYARFGQALGWTGRAAVVVAVEALARLSAQAPQLDQAALDG